MSISGALNLIPAGFPEGVAAGVNGNRRPGAGSAADDARTLPPASESAVDPAQIENQDVPEQSSASAPSRSLVDPANLSQAQAAAEGAETAEGDGETLTISARLVAVTDEDSTQTVALDGRPEAAKSGELVSEAQRLTGEPLEVPDYSIDPAERDIQVFNERISRATDVLQFLNSRPSPRSSGGGVSIVV
tara:strand:- start:1125 stop:1694 length:570 start_codon:yes stop_codon:yes gene_type:complete